VQALAEAERWGIPVTISSDPRHHFQQVLGVSAQDRAFSVWPELLGFASIHYAELTRRFADIARREYRAVGLRESLAPQADLATEPRWARINGAFGSEATTARQMVEAYVAGIQNGARGLNSGSVAAVVKHWVGYIARWNLKGLRRSTGPQSMGKPKMNRSACVKKRSNGHAVQKMKVGPSEPACRGRLQTAMNCCSQKLWW
jgi:Glycosyl hydrolase family 3 N terminal domain